MVVHSRCVPTGDIHLICHLADGIAERISQILVPCSCNDNAYREADGADTGEVVVDGSRAVTVICADLADGINGVRLVAAERNNGVHVVKGQLIHEGIPLRIVLSKTDHVFQLQIVGSARRDRFSIRILILCCRFRCQVVADVVECGLGIFGNLEGSRSCCGLVVICKFILAGEICDIAFSIVELILRCDEFALSLVVACVLNCISDFVCLTVDDIVGVGVDGDNIVTLLKNISAGVFSVIGSHVFHIECDLDLL